MGVAKKLGIVLVIYFLIGFVLFYMISTGMMPTEIWSTISVVMNYLFLPVAWVFNILAPFLGLTEVAVAIAFPF